MGVEVVGQKLGKGFGSIKKPHPLFAVPVIAVADAVLMGLGNRAYEIATGNYSIIKWPGSFWVFFWYTLIFATIVGVILGPIFYVIGTKIPEPKLAWLLLFGAMLGPLPISILDRELPNWTGLVMFSALGLVSAAIWWLIVEAPRSRALAAK